MTMTNERGQLHRVLCIPELLDMIFSSLDKVSNASNARVCKRWSDVALDSLWREVDDLRRLLDILSPLKLNDEEQYEFDVLPDATRWARFDKYATRVRKLEYNYTESRGRLRRTVFDDVARTRTRLNVLPNMHTLQWKADLDLSVMFMHSGIKTFIIYLPESLTQVSARPFFEDLAARVPNITNLNLRSTVPARHLERDLISLVRHLSKLKTITFPRYYLTTKMTEALSMLPQLGVLEFQYMRDQGYGDPEDTRVYSPTVSEGSFPALWDFSLAASFSDVGRFFDQRFAPTNVTTLYIDSEWIETAKALQDFFVIIVENCQLVKYLAMISQRDPSARELLDSSFADSDDIEDYFIKMEHIKPVLRLPMLTTFEVLHHLPISLTSEDIELLASSLRAIETLILSNEPVPLTKPSLTLEALLPFARHCPNLSHLGVFLDATTAPEMPEGSSIDLPQFRRLKKLSMGVSPIDDPDLIVLYLSHILPLGCLVDSGITWEDFSPDPHSEDEREEVNYLYEEVQQRCDVWNRVDDMLPMLTRLRLEERNRTLAMARELDDLRMRTGVLKDSLKVAGNDLATCIMI